MPFVALPAVAATAATVGTTVSAAWAAASAVAAFAFKQLLMAGVSRLAMALFGPKQKRPERQASLTNLSLGEQPRVALFGRVAVAGTALGGGNWGGSEETDWEVLRIQLADHRCDALEGFYIDDTWHAFTGDGPVAGIPDGHLEIYWRSGAAGETLPPKPDWLTAAQFDAADTLDGGAEVWVAYKYDDKIWTQGRPRFLFVVRGARLYDPRKDSTVAGGSGSHRWDDPSTWEWSENAYLAFYNYQRGLYALDQVDEPAQLMMGRGLSAAEAPPERAIARANICDELAPKAGGGTEARYRIGAAVLSDESHLAVTEKFAAAMAGVVTQPDGGVDIEPGAARTAVVEITDLDLIAGEPVRMKRFATDNDRVNTVAARYIEPTLRWVEHDAPIRRDLADVTADGGSKRDPLTLDFVTSGHQAQRVAEIRRRLARLFRRGSIVLGPRFQPLEEGDWIGWTSARYFEGERLEFRITRAAIGANKRVALSIEQVEAEAFEDPDDLIAPTSEPAPTPPTLGSLSLAGVTLAAADLNGQPAVLAQWTAPVSTGIDAVVLELRRLGETEATPTLQPDPSLGQVVATNGVRPDGGQMQARLVPVADAARQVTASAWTTLSMVGLTSAETTAVGGQAAANVADATGRSLAGLDSGGTVSTGKVETLSVAAGNITPVNQSRTTGSVTWTAEATEKTLQTVTDVVVKRGVVKIFGACDINFDVMSGAAAYVTLRLYRDGVHLVNADRVLNCRGAAATWMPPPQGFLDFNDTPGAGTYDYELKLLPSEAVTGQVRQRSLGCDPQEG